MDGAERNRLVLSRRAVAGGTIAAAIAAMMPNLLTRVAGAQQA